MYNVVSLFDAGLITTIANVLFFVVIGLIVITVLLSLRKGIVKNSYKLIWNSIFIMIGVFATPAIATSVANIDISSLGTINVSGVDVAATTIKETLEHAILALGGNDTASIQYIFLNDPETVKLVTSLAMMLISFALFIIWMLLVVTVFTFIGWIIYICAVKPVVKHIMKKKALKLQEAETNVEKIEAPEEDDGKKKRHKKPKKVKIKPKLWSKLSGAGIRLVNCIVITALFIAPISAIVNTVTSVVHSHKDDGKPITNETYNSLLSYIDAYDNSILAKSFFVLEDSKGRTVDMNIMNYIASTELNGTKLHFVDEVTNILDIGLTLLESGAFNPDGSLNQTALLTKDIVSFLLNSLSNSNLFSNVFAIVGNVAINYAAVQNILDKEKVDVTGVSWSQELKNVDKIYGALYDSGIVTSLLDGAGTFNIPVIPGEERDAMANALKFIDESDLLKVVVPAVVHKLATKENPDGTPSPVGEYITTDWNDYGDIVWGQELGIVYNFITGLYDEAQIDINELINQGGTPTPQPDAGTGGEPGTGTGGEPGAGGAPLALAPYKAQEGTTTEGETTPTPEGETNPSAPQNSLLDKLLGEENFTKVISLITGKVEEGLAAPETCLLDSNLLFHSFDKLMNKVYGMLEQSQKDVFTPEDKKNFDTAVASLDTKEKIKDEFDSVLYTAKYIVVDGKVTDGLNLDNVEQKEALKKSATYIDESKIFTTIIPSFLEGMTKTLDFGEGIPIKGSDLNFKDITFGTELPMLLDCYSDIMDLSTALGGGSASDIITKLDTVKLSNVLKTFNISKILNPEVITGQKRNFYKILDMIFDSDQFKPMGFYPTSSPDYDGISDWNKEIDGIANIFSTIKTEDLISIITTATSLDAFDGAKVEKLLCTIDGSKLIKDTFGCVLDTSLKDIVDKDINVSFEYVSSWAQEGANLNKIITEFKKFGSDISNIDWLNSDTAKIKGLLEAFVDSQMFGDDQAFGNYVHKLLKKVNSLTPYLKDYGTTGESYTQSLADFNTITKAEWKDSSLNANDGEIQKICNVIDAFKTLGGNNGTAGLDKITSGNFKANELTPIIEALCDARAFHTITINAIDSAVKSPTSPINIKGLHLNKINTEILVPMDGEQMKTELLVLPEIIEKVEGLVSNTGNVATFDETIIRSLLELTHGSRLINTLSSATVAPENELTVFEEIIQFIINETGVKTYLFRTPLDASSEENAIKQMILGIGNKVGHNVTDGWVVDGPNNDEIDRLMNVITGFKAAGLDNVDAGTLNKLTKDKIVGLLSPINESHLLHRAMGNMIKTGFNALDSSIKTSVFGGSEPNYYLENIDGVFEDQITPTEINLYNVEIDHLADLLDTVNTLTNNDGSLKEFNELTIRNLLELTHDSLLFNSFDKSVLSPKTSLTPFENIVRYIIEETGVKTYLFKNPSLTPDQQSAEIRNSIINIGNKVRPLATDGWVVEGDNNDEIDRLMNVITGFKAAGLDNVDAGTLNKLTKDKIVGLLTPINESKLLHNAMGNMIKTGFNALDNSIKSNVFGDSEPNYYLENIDGVFEDEITSTEINLYNVEIDHLADLLDTVNTLTKPDGSLKEFNEVTIRSLLELTHDSLLFNSFNKSVVNVNTSLTPFENIVRYIIDQTGVKQYLFKSDSLSPTEQNNHIRDMIIAIGNHNARPIAADGWVVSGTNNDEIDRLMNIITGFKAAGLDNIDASNLNTLTKDKIVGLLTPINESHLLHNAMGNMIKTGFNALDTSIKTNVFGGCEPNYYLENIDGVFEDQLTPTEINLYNVEIDYLADLLDIVNNLTNPDGSLKEFNELTIRSLLELTHNSLLFNSFAKSVSPETSLTLFENIVRYIIDETGVKQYLFKSESLLPSQQSDQIKKNIINIGNKARALATDGWVVEGLNNDEIDRLMNVITGFKTAGLGNVDASGLNTLTKEQIISLLQPINESYLLHNAIGNMIKTGFNTLDATIRNDVFGGSEPNYYLENITGVYQDHLTPEEVNYYNVEISYLADLLDVVDKTIQPNGSLVAFDENNIRSLLELTHDSLLFNSFSSKVITPESELTLFEQIVKFIISETGVKSYLFKDEVLSPSQQDERIASNIINIGNKARSINNDGWVVNGINNDEIDRLMNVITGFKAAGLGNIDANGLNALSQAQIASLLKPINESHLLHNAIGKMIKTGFDTLSPDLRNNLFGGATPNFYLRKLNGLTPLTIDEEIGYYNHEIDYLAELIGFVMNPASNFANMQNINSTTLLNMLNTVAKSRIFNTSADFAPTDNTRNVFTPFENWIKYSLTQTGIHKFFNIMADDQTNLNTLITKIKEVSFSDPSVYGWIDGTYGFGENANIIHMIDEYQALGIKEFTKEGFIKMDIESFTRLVAAFEKSHILSPIAQTIKNIRSSIPQVPGI